MSRMKISIALRVVLKAYVYIHQFIDGFTLLLEKRFGCFSYITFPIDR